MSEERNDRRLALVRVEGSNVYLVISTIGEDVAERELHQHYIEDRTCPSNLARGTEEVLVIDDDGVDTDPHGVFELVDVVDQPADWPFSGDVTPERYISLFPSMQALIDKQQGS